MIFKAHVNPAISRAIDIVSPPDPTAAQLTPEQEEEAYDLNVYGRLNLWPNYMDEQHQKKMKEASEIMRTVNPAVRKDLEDYLIIQGISPDLEEFAASKSNSQTESPSQTPEKLRVFFDPLWCIVSSNWFEEKQRNPKQFCQWQRS